MNNYIQEGLTNIAKHAGAQQVWLNLKGNSHCVSLIIQDDGKGFSVEKPHQGGFGLSIMEERARLAGASLTISSEVGKGSRITFIWKEEAGEYTDSDLDCG
jgi:signal transduction histidine kinase